MLNSDWSGAESSNRVPGLVLRLGSFPPASSRIRLVPGNDTAAGMDDAHTKTT